MGVLELWVGREGKVRVEEEMKEEGVPRYALKPGSPPATPVVEGTLVGLRSFGGAHV